MLEVQMAKLEEFGHLQGQRDGKAMKSATEAKPSRRKWRPPGLYYLTVRVSRGLGTPIQTRVWHAEFFDDYFPMERLLAVGRIFYIVESRQRPRPALELIVESTADWQPPDPPVISRWPRLIKKAEAPAVFEPDWDDLVPFGPEWQ